VFVVGCLGGWQRAAAVLFERASLSGHPAPSREAGQDVTGTISAGAHPGSYNGQDAYNDMLIAHSLGADGFDAGEDGTGRGTPLFVTHALDSYSAGRATEDETGRGCPLVAFSAKDYGADAGELAPTLRAGGHDASHANGGCMPAIAFHENQRGECSVNDTVGAINSGGGKPGQGYPAIAFDARQSDMIQYGEKTGPLDTDGHTMGVCLPINTQIATRHNALGRGTGFGIGEPGDPAFTLQAAHHHAVATAMHVRRLTPRECERLQGFPDDYTLIPYRGKPAADGPRYKALGNSMAVPVMAWIGRRIQLVEAIA